MQIVLDILKRYVFEIACGACAVLGIVFCLLGLQRMSGITEQMEQASQVQTRLATAARESEPINMQAVKLEQQRIKAIGDSYRSVLDFAAKLNRYEPLSSPAFPGPTRPKHRIAYREAYRKEVDSWLGLLRAGDVPTLDDIARERDRMDAERPADESLGADPEAEGIDEPEPLEDRDPLETAEVRAAIRNAKSLYCYATRESFHVSDVSRSDGPMFQSVPPTPEQMWHAQLEVWLQRSIINAIAEINNSEAERLKAEAQRRNDDGLRPWVGNLPIKEVSSIQTSTYYLMKDGNSTVAQRGGGTQARAYPPDANDPVFTGNLSNDLYELMRFSLVLVVDGRDVPLILAGLCRGNFNTPLRVEYEALPPNTSMQDKIFGDEPLVKLTVDFETVMFSEFYLELMPDEILARVNKKRPEPPKAEGT